MMREPKFRMAAIALVGLALHGCAGSGMGLFATGTDVAVGADVDHTTGGIAYKTFAASSGELRVAALNALRRLDLAVVRDGPKEDRLAIVATARKRRVEIEIEPLSGGTARMRVAANQGEVLVKDAATAAEIIVQTAATLDDLMQRRQEARRPAGRTG